MNIASLIDHTALKPDTTIGQIRKLCAEAREYGFASVCVNPVWVSLCAELLEKSGVKICAVVGFPFGATPSIIKMQEAMMSVRSGACEIDMVIDIGALKSGYVTQVEWDIFCVRRSIPEAKLKVIIETCLLTDAEKVAACHLAQKARAHFVKTSTGFSSGGATIEDVRLMRKAVEKDMGVKASGGIRDFATAKAMIDAGASRIGCSASIAIVNGAKEEAGNPGDVSVS